MKDFWTNLKRLLRGERAPVAPTPVERHCCYGCRQRFEGSGYRVADRRYCEELCSPPFLRRMPLSQLVAR